MEQFTSRVRCCGTVYQSTCGKHKLSLALNPAAAVSFLARINVNIIILYYMESRHLFYYN